MCLPHDFLNVWLTGEFATEPGDASGTAYFDVRTRTYSQTVLSLLDADRDWVATVPRIVESLSVIGSLRRAAAEALGLPHGVPVSAGGGDNMQAAIGSGATRTGPVVVSLGTSGTIFAYSPQPAVDPQGEAAAFCDSTGGWLPLVCTLNCTVATEWVRRLLGVRDHVEFETLLAAAPPGAEGLTFLPYLGGERTPNCPTGAGVFSGVRSEHGREHFVRAVVEGVTFGLGYAMDALRRAGVQPAEITLVGGGAGSDGWAQVCADIFGLPVQRSARTEAAAAGAALQARWVVEAQPPPTLANGPRWQPRVEQALIDARERADRLRDQAVAGTL
jgi:xylulokinase